MKISVIIPTYKPGNYLWECLNSLLVQTFSKKDFEIILVLNGCNDPYKSEIQNYIDTKMHGINIIFIHTMQGGVSNARNIGLDNAKGEYVTFIDDDDFVSPKFLQELYDNVTPSTISLCYPFAFNDSDSATQIPYRITEAYDYCVKHNKTTLISKVRKFFSGPCMKLIPINFIQNRRYDVRFKNGEDSLFMFLISDKINKVSFTSKNAVYYRRNRKNSAITQKRKVLDILRTGIDLMLEYSKIWMSSPIQYNLSYYLCMIFATIKNILLNLFRSLTFKS
ncbi:MAG: glycosyltransferase family 2 protein [Lentimicrobiaceae bacterium]|nr:glycosyltransferase family 2 protein [Lentimicrobiaceae bacterium]